MQSKRNMCQCKWITDNAKCGKNHKTKEKRLPQCKVSSQCIPLYDFCSIYICILPIHYIIIVSGELAWCAFYFFFFIFSFCSWSFIIMIHVLLLPLRLSLSLCSFVLRAFTIRVLEPSASKRARTNQQPNEKKEKWSRKEQQREGESDNEKKSEIYIFFRFSLYVSSFKANE